MKIADIKLKNNQAWLKIQTDVDEPVGIFHVTNKEIIKVLKEAQKQGYKLRLDIEEEREEELEDEFS